MEDTNVFRYLSMDRSMKDKVNHRIEEGRKRGCYNEASMKTKFIHGGKKRKVQRIMV